MQTENEKIIFLSRLPAQQLALVAQNNPNDTIIDSILVKRIKNLSYGLKDWLYPLPLEERQNIIRCIQNGLVNPTNNFYSQLKTATLPAYKTQTKGLQNMFLNILEKFAILAPINFNDEKRHFFDFFLKNLEHNALVDRMDMQRQASQKTGTEHVSLGPKNSNTLFLRTTNLVSSIDQTK